jgi:hypothetical protein
MNKKNTIVAEYVSGYAHLHDIDIETEQSRLIDKLNSLRLDPLDEVEEEPAIVSAIVEGKNYKLLSAGNISVISGAAKSRKTFVISSIAAACIKNSGATDEATPSLILNMYANLKDKRTKVLYFDTEQSKYHAQRVNRRICDLTRIDSPKNLYYYKLRGLDAKECLALITTAIDLYKNEVGIICIDGIADLLSTGINNEAEANEVILEFMRITEEQHVHICTILHTNKAKQGETGTLTGWIGTQILKKAETILVVKKDKDRANVSYIVPTETRDLCFESFAFEVDENGTPRATTGTEKDLPEIYDILNDSLKIKVLKLIAEKGELNKLKFKERLKLELIHLEQNEANLTLHIVRARIDALLNKLLYENIINEVSLGRTKVIELNNEHVLFTQQKLNLE